MNAPSGSQQPLAVDDPSLQVPSGIESQVKGSVIAVEGVGVKRVGVGACAAQEGVEVVPSGNYPQRTTLGMPAPAPGAAAASSAASGRMGLPAARAPRPTRTSVRDDQTEIISMLPDLSAPRRRRPQNRKVMSPLRLLGLFVTVQAVLGLLAFALFGGLVRSWLLGARVEVPEGVSVQEAVALRDDILESQSAYQRLGSDLDVVKKQIAVSPGDAWKQLEILGERNELTLLADDAITNGSRVAFDKLVAMAKDGAREKRLRDGAAAEILRVKHFYASGTRLGSYALPVATLYPSLRTKSEEELDSSRLVDLLGDGEKLWRVRTRAAYLLGSRRSLDVCEALVKAAQTDTNLDVVKECVFSFEENTGYRAKGLFEIEDLLAWWGVYQERSGVVEAEARDPDPG